MWKAMFIACLCVTSAGPAALAGDPSTAERERVDESLQGILDTLDNLYRIGLFTDKEQFTRVETEVKTLSRLAERLRDGSNPEERKAYLESCHRLLDLIGDARTSVRASLAGEIPPELLDNLHRACGQVDSVLLRQALLEMAGGTPLQDIESELLGARAECDDYWIEALGIIDSDISAIKEEEKQLKLEIENLKRQLEAEPDPERKEEIQGRIKKVETKLENKQIQRQQKEKVKGKLDLWKLLSGIAGALVGGAIIFFSGGTLTEVGLALIVGSGGMVADAVNDSLKEHDRTVIVTEDGELVREGVEADRIPTSEEREQFKLPDDQTAITNTSSGNFVLAIKKDNPHIWYLHQIAPSRLIANVEVARVTVPDNPYGVKSFSEISNPREADVVDPAGRISLFFVADVGGSAKKCGLTETKVGSQEYELSVGQAP